MYTKTESRPINTTQPRATPPIMAGYDIIFAVVLEPVVYAGLEVKRYSPADLVCGTVCLVTGNTSVEIILSDVGCFARVSWTICVSFDKPEVEIILLVVDFFAVVTSSDVCWTVCFLLGKTVVEIILEVVNGFVAVSSLDNTVFAAGVDILELDVLKFIRQIKGRVLLQLSNVASGITVSEGVVAIDTVLQIELSVEALLIESKFSALIFLHRLISDIQRKGWVLLLAQTSSCIKPILKL